MTISNEAVEAAAKVFYQDGWEGPPFWESLDADDPSRIEYLATARAALEAAAPFIRADAGAKALEEAAEDFGDTYHGRWLRARAAAVRGEG